MPHSNAPVKLLFWTISIMASFIYSGDQGIGNPAIPRESEDKSQRQFIGNMKVKIAAQSHVKHSY